MNTDFDSTNRQLSSYICKVRGLADSLNGEDPSIIDAVYRTLILCFNNCEEQPDESRRAYYTKHCFIPTVKNNQQAVNFLIQEWKTIDRVNIEYWLRSAEVMIGDNKSPLSKNAIDLIIDNLNIIAVPE